MNDVERWLEPRLVGVPEALRERILQAVGGERGAGKAGVVEGLRAAGERLLHQAVQASPGRDTAVTLLAADALMTFACEAIAETNPEGLVGQAGG